MGAHVAAATAIPPSPRNPKNCWLQAVNPPPPFQREKPNVPAQRGGEPFFQQMRFPVPRISVPGPKHTFLLVVLVGVMWKPKAALNLQKKFHLSVCTWFLINEMSESATDPVVYALL